MAHRGPDCMASLCVFHLTLVLTIVVTCDFLVDCAKSKSQHDSVCLYLGRAPHCSPWEVYGAPSALCQVQRRGGEVEGRRRQGLQCSTRQAASGCPCPAAGAVGWGAGDGFPLEGALGAAGTVLFMGTFIEQRINSRFGQ